MFVINAESLCKSTCLACMYALSISEVARAESKSFKEFISPVALPESSAFASIKIKA